MRCAIYVRVSTDRDEQKTSLENQKSLFYNFIAEKGWELAEFYVDVESGTTDKREAFSRLIQDAEKRRFDCILAKELSRLARNGELAYRMKRLLHANKVHLITLDGAINTLEDNTDKFGLYAWLYEEESQRTSRRIKTALAAKAKKGEFKGSNPPYGYLAENKRLVKRDDSTVEAVLLIFSLYLQGKGVEAIAKELDRRGFPTPAHVAGKSNAGLFWHGSAVKLILKNPHYVGDMVQGRSRTRSVTDKAREIVPADEWLSVENTHEPIIAREDYDAVQAVMNSRVYKQRKVKKHLFTNYLFCADCGSGMWYLQNRKGYVCGRYKKHSVCACTSHAIKEQFLKDLILQDLREMAGTVDQGQVLNRVKEQVRKAENERRKRILQKERELEELKVENRQYLKLLAHGTITQEEYQDAVEANRRKITGLQEQVQSSVEAGERVSQQKDVIRLLSKELAKVLEFGDLTEELLHRLVDRIEVGEHQQVTIHYRFASPVPEAS
ncbi:MAG TPA: recombinase family protein [Symbiobacteriaceae bacterium]|nr:recombinase family protein [Symbiobacteriaceae bacterium]